MEERAEPASLFGLFYGPKSLFIIPDPPDFLLWTAVLPGA